MPESKHVQHHRAGTKDTLRMLTTQKATGICRRRVRAREECAGVGARAIGRAREREGVGKTGARKSLCTHARPVRIERG